MQSQDGLIPSISTVNLKTQFHSLYLSDLNNSWQMIEALIMIKFEILVTLNQLNSVSCSGKREPSM